MRPAKLILNLTAGRGRAGKLLPDILLTLKSYGVDADCAQTRAPQHASELAQRAKADGFDWIIAAGGDGTIHEVVNGLACSTGDGAVGQLSILPIGSGNDYAKMLDMPNDWRVACARIAAGKRRQVDLGRINDRFFVNNVGVGFDAQVGIEARKVTWARGFAIYVAALARNMLLSYRTPQVSIELDGVCWSQRITLLTIGLGRCSGGGFWLTPDAQIDDGLFDLCIARELSKPQILALVPHVMKGTHVNKEPVRMARARNVVVTSDEPLPVHADGEILYSDAHRLAVELLPQKLAVIS